MQGSKHYFALIRLRTQGPRYCAHRQMSCNHAELRGRHTNLDRYFEYSRNAQYCLIPIITQNFPGSQPDLHFVELHYSGKDCDRKLPHRTEC